MSIEEKKSMHRVEFIGEFKHIIVETKTAFLRDDVEIEGTATYHRDSITCGDFAKADLLGVRDLAEVAWTRSVIEAYEQHQAHIAEHGAQGDG